MATFRALPELWRKYFVVAAPDIPTDFLVAWIDKESGGNMCNWTGPAYREAGIFQLMPAKNGAPDAGSGSNVEIAGTTYEALRSACVPDASNVFSHDPSLEEKQVQVDSGIRYVRWCMDQARKALAAVGATWDETSADFWKMVKLAHTLPSLFGGLATAAAALGHPPANWQEFVDNGAGTMFGGAKWLPNADWVGQYGVGGGASNPIQQGIQQSIAKTQILVEGLGLSPVEIGLAILGVALGGFGALYFNRWLNPGQSV